MGEAYNCRGGAARKIEIGALEGNGSFIRALRKVSLKMKFLYTGGSYMQLNINRRKQDTQELT